MVAPLPDSHRNKGQPTGDLILSEVNNLKIHNWERWQSYRSDRGQPPWIKIHREVMRHIEWVSLTDAQRGQLVAIWLLAADRNGVIPASPKIIQKLCHMDNEPDINLFIINGFIDGVIVASNGCQSDSPEKSREETDKSREDKKKNSAAFALPDWVNSDDWNLWLKTRKKKMIPEQMQAQVDKLAAWRESGLDYAGALSKAAIDGYQGLFLPNEKQSSRKSPQVDNFENKDYGKGVNDL